MTPDVTIHLSFGAAGATAAQVDTASGGATAGAAPPPLGLDQLQAGAVGAAPPPQSAAELAAQTATTTTTAAAGEAPAPMAIEALMSSVTAAAPVPQEPGALLGAEGGPPTPVDPETLGEPAAPEAPKSESRRRG